MAKLDTFIKILVDGHAAVAGLGKVEQAARDVDDEIDDLGGQGNDKMSALAAGTEALAGKMKTLAGPAGVGAVVGGMVAAVEKTIELGIQADTIATALDITTEEASRLAAAFGDVGIEANDLVDIGLQIQGGLEDNTELTDRLGVVMSDLQSPVDAIRVGIDNWDLLTPTERATLFGEEGVRQISRMVAEGQTLDQILAGVADIRVISEADAERARKMAASMAELKGLVEGVTLVVGGNLLEAFENIQAVADVLPGDLEAATIAAELFAAALAPGLTIIGKIDDAVNLAAETFLGKLDPAAQTVADSVLRAFEPVETGVDDIGTAADETGKDFTELARTVGRSMSASEASVTGFKNVLNIDEQIRAIGTKLEDSKENFDVWSQESKDNVRDLAGDVLDLAEDLGVATAERTARIEIAYNANDIAALEAELTELTRLRDVFIRIRQIGASGGSALPGLPFPSSSVTNNVTINASRTLSGRELSQLSQDWARVNG